jgi:hypothetical protein
MSAQVTTIASGIVFLGLFVLVAWNLRRRHNGPGQSGAGERMRDDGNQKGER